MKTNLFLLTLLFAMTGCAPKLQYSQDAFSKRTCCKARDGRLKTSDENFTAIMTIRRCADATETSVDSRRAQVTLTLVEIDIHRYGLYNPKTVTLVTNSGEYSAKILQVFNRPTVNVSKATVGHLIIGLPKQTYKTYIFELNSDHMTSISNSESLKIRLNVSPDYTVDIVASEGEMDFIKEFKAKCFDQQPNETEK